MMTRLVGCLGAMLFTLSAFGEQPINKSNMTPEEIREANQQESHKIVFVGNGEQASADSVARAVRMFYADQYRHFKDPLAPNFLLMSRDANIAMGIGGAVRMRGWADFNGSINANGFIPYLIPVPSDPTQRRRIGGTPGGTSLFMRVIGFNTLIKTFNAYIQADFSGPGNVGFKLKKAYVIMSDWTVGYATTTFADPAAEVPTIDGAGPNGEASKTAMLVRWMHDFNSHWSMAASVEMPSSQVDADGTRTQVLNDWMPDYVAFGQYSWAHGQHVRLSGMMRTIPYRDLVTGVNHNKIGWGAQLSTFLKPANPLAIFGIVNYGEGYGSYMGDLSVGNYDLVPTAGHPGQLHAPRSLGISGGLRYSFRPNVYACAAYGQARYYNHDSEYKSTDYRIGRYFAANIFWEPTPRLQAGIEYLWGQRNNFDGNHNHANRVDVLFQFSF
ncbi:MAG: hypothetical protein HDT01_00730 [Bacteroidales bacterium]|nr:hypothetical protein [Bacteroidales bacterium]